MTIPMIHWLDVVTTVFAFAFLAAVVAGAL
jgi:hypothetical protein